MSVAIDADAAAAAAARARLIAALAAAARRCARETIKRRARAYAAEPADLEAIAPGLSAAAPEELIAAGAALLRREAAAPARWFGFGGEAPALNARALILLGRALRRLAAPAPRRPVPPYRTLVRSRPGA